MPKVHVDIKKLIEARESSVTKAEVVKKTGYPEKAVDYYLRLCQQNGVQFSHKLKRIRNGIDWNEVKEYLKSLQK